VEQHKLQALRELIEEAKQMPVPIDLDWLRNRSGVTIIPVWSAGLTQYMLRHPGTVILPQDLFILLHSEDGGGDTRWRITLCNM